MSGNTRGKLKEHFEGIHRNLDWCVHHVNQSLALIDQQLRITDAVTQLGNDEAAIQKYIQDYPLYKGIFSLGAGIKTLDELSQGIYEKI